MKCKAWELLAPEQTEYQSTLTALSIFCFLMGVFYLSYSGKLISDDEELFTSAARNQAVRGKLLTEQIYGNTRLTGGNLNVGVAHPLIASNIYKLIKNTDLGFIQSVLFLNGFYTALSAIIVYVLAIRFGYSQKVCLITTVIFALGTIAWVYARTFFREPLAMFLLLGAWLVFDLALDKSLANWLKFNLWILFLLIFFIVALTKLMLSAIFPVFLFIAWQRKVAKNKTTSIEKIIFLSTILGFLGLFHLILLGKFSVFRISDTLVHFTQKRIATISHHYFGKAIIGSLFSTGKGLFVYSPILLLVFPSIKMHNWKKPEITIIPLVSLLLLLSMQALIYDRFWWNITWGTRYLLPIIPFLVIGSLPAIEYITKAKSHYISFLFFSLISLSLAIQLGCILIDTPTYNIYLFKNHSQIYPEPVLWNIRYAPFFIHWKLFFSGFSWATAWSRNLPTNITGVFIIIAITSLSIGMSIKQLFRPIRKHSFWKIVINLTKVIITLLLPILILNVYRHDPTYYGEQKEYQIATTYINQNSGIDDIILIHSYRYPIWYYIMNFERTDATIYSLPMRWTDEKNSKTLNITNEDLLKLLLSFDNQYQTLWLITEEITTKSTLTTEEKYFAQKCTLLSRHNVSNNKSIRISTFDISIQSYNSR